MRYPKYLIFLDGFGLLGLCSALAFVLLPSELRPENHLDSLWGNISTELLGIWIGVRFIEWIIRAHESSTKARVRVVRNMRYVESLFHQVLDFRRPFHLIQLHRELDWIGTRLKQRVRHLQSDEEADVRAFYIKVYELLKCLPSRAEAQEAADRQQFIVLDGVTLLYERLGSIESARCVAENNILEETDEDEGI